MTDLRQPYDETGALYGTIHQGYWSHGQDNNKTTESTHAYVAFKKERVVANDLTVTQ